MSNKYSHQCQGKQRHSCMKKAEVSLASLKRKDEREGRETPPMSAYWCMYCKGYHIGRLNAEKAKFYKRT